MAKLLWTARANFGPSPRAGQAMAYDSGRGRVVLVGGAAGGDPLAGTWEWDGHYWTQMSDIGPGARTAATLEYDTGRRRTILFGGIGPGAIRLNDTWAWDGENWTQLAESGPAARSGHAVAYDRMRNRMVLFGGSGGEEHPELNDTWEFDGEAWTQMEDIGPAARRDHALAFCRRSSRVILFGGTAGDQDLDDTWSWDGATWRQSVDFGPPPRRQAGVTSAGDHVELFGGEHVDGAATTVRRDTWRYDGRLWTQLQDIGPAARCGPAMAFDEQRDRVILFGGQGDPAAGEGRPRPFFGDTWEHTVVRAPAPDPDQIPPRIVNGLVVNPNQANAGQNVTVTVHLAMLLDVTVEVWLVSLPQRVLEDDLAAGVDPTVIFAKGEFLAIVNIPPALNVFAKTVAAPAGPGALSVLAATSPDFFVFAALTINP